MRKAAASSPSTKERKESPATLLQQLTKQGVVGNSDSGDGKRDYLSNSSGGFGHNAVKFLSLILFCAVIIILIVGVVKIGG